MNIINFGSCNIDVVYEVEHFVKPGETISSKGFKRFPGGKGLNQSIAIAKSGVKCFHAGCIGEDGEFLRNLLIDSGVDTTYLKTVNTPSGKAIIQVDSNGENCIILSKGANYEITKEYIDEVLGNFSEGDVLVLQNEISNLSYIIDKAYALKMKIIFNPAPFDIELKNVDLNKIHTLILNETEAFGFTGSYDIEKIQTEFKEKYQKLNVVLTLGSKGSIYFDNNETEYCPAFQVKAVDTTSAGDTFMGYYIYALTRNLDVLERLKFASAASAIAVSKEGAAVSIPELAEVEKSRQYLKVNNKELY